MALTTNTILSCSVVLPHDYATSIAVSKGFNCAPPTPHEPTPFISAYKYLCTAWSAASFVCPLYSVHVANSQKRHTAPSDRYRVVKMRTKRKASYALQIRPTALPAHGRGPQNPGRTKTRSRLECCSLGKAWM